MSNDARPARRFRFSIRDLFMATAIAASLSGWIVEWRKRSQLESRFAPIMDAMDKVADGYGDNLRGYLDDQGLVVDFEVTSVGQRLIDSGSSEGATSGSGVF